MVAADRRGGRKPTEGNLNHFKKLPIGVESDQQVNIYSFAVRCDRSGLVLNGIGFILVQATCPTSSLSRLVTLFLSLGAQSLQWGYKREGERWGVQEVRSALVGRAESDWSYATS